VQAWTVEDLAAELTGSRLGSTEIGRKIFQEATCVLCHKIAGAGGAVGPELTDVFKRLKHDRVALLREVLDPSHKIDPKYALYNVVLDDGKILTGIVTDQNAETITVISNPEKPQPQVVARDEIDELAKTPASLMPKGLLDRFTREEILELLAFLEAGGGKAIDD
jgi:putative heme-binding domain-containing protein